MSSEERTYHAVVNGTTFDVRTNGTRVLVDNVDADVSLVRSRTHDYSLIVDAKSYDLAVEPLEDGTIRVTRAGKRAEVQVLDRAAILLERLGLDRGDSKHQQDVRAPMPGLVVTVLASPGDRVEAGQGILVLEAMKMENQLATSSAAIIETVHVKPGDAVSKNQLLVSCKPVVG